jgi:hypothetical protein
MPSSEEVDTILRDAPRFELAQLPDETSATRWKWMGQRVIRSALRNSLQRSVGPVLKDELHLYGHALSQWSYQALKKMEAVINSYADAYRVQIHRVNGLSEGIGDRVEVEKDLTLLRNWSPEENSDLAVKRA